MTCVNKNNIMQYCLFDGTNYRSIFKLWPNSKVIFADSSMIALGKWAVELGSFSPFDANPEYIILNYAQDGQEMAECLYAGQILVVGPNDCKPTICTPDEFKRDWEPLEGVLARSTEEK